MKKIILLSIIFLTILSCGNNTSATKPAVSTPTPVAQPAAENLLTLPPVTSDFANNLYANCDYIDIIMYKEGFSMNISQKNSIQTVVAGLSGSNPSLGSNCPAQGRLFFQNQGQTIGEADLHFTTGVCAALVFYENGKKAYTSQLTEKGAGIFANYFQNAMKLKNQAGQQQQ